MLTAVIDTNVLIDATADYRSTAHEIIELVIRGKVRAAASGRIEGEYRALIARATARRARQELDDFFDCVERVRTHECVEAKSEDHDDQKFLDCAGAAGAEFIITNDHHLLDLGSSGATTIVTPKEFIARYQSAQDPEGKRAWREWVKQIMGNG